MNIFRKYLWKIALKKIYIVTSPTKETYEHLKSLKLCEDKKLKILFDPVINVSEINTNMRKTIENYDDFYLMTGRLTNQKNFFFCVIVLRN